MAFVVEPRAELAMSDIAVARRVDPLTEGRNEQDPLEFSGGRVTPSVGDTVAAGTNAALYFQIYAAVGSERPEVTLDYSRDGAAIARVQPELGAAGADGTIPVLAVAQLKPGEYQVHAVVRQGGKAAEETATVTVDER
jgi:hypothetical protein